MGMCHNMFVFNLIPNGFLSLGAQRSHIDHSETQQVLSHQGEDQADELMWLAEMVGHQFFSSYSNFYCKCPVIDVKVDFEGPVGPSAPLRDLVSYNSLAAACAKSGDLEGMHRWISKIEAGKVWKAPNMAWPNDAKICQILPNDLSVI